VGAAEVWRAWAAWVNSLATILTKNAGYLASGFLYAIKAALYAVSPFAGLSNLGANWKVWNRIFGLAVTQLTFGKVIVGGLGLGSAAFVNTFFSIGFFETCFVWYFAHFGAEPTQRFIKFVELIREELGVLQSTQPNQFHEYIEFCLENDGTPEGIALRQHLLEIFHSQMKPMDWEAFRKDYPKSNIPGYEEFVSGPIVSETQYGHVQSVEKNDTSYVEVKSMTLFGKSCGDGKSHVVAKGSEEAGWGPWIRMKFGMGGSG
jgi:hypothetical protein